MAQQRVWSNHKYIKKVGNRYYYPEDIKGNSKPRKLINTMTDADGNNVNTRGIAASRTISNKSQHYDRVSGERLTPSEYRRQTYMNNNIARPVSKTPTSVPTSVSQAWQRSGYSGGIQRVVPGSVKKKEEVTITKNESTSKETAVNPKVSEEDDKKKKSGKSDTRQSQSSAKKSLPSSSSKPSTSSNKYEFSSSSSVTTVPSTHSKQSKSGKTGLRKSTQSKKGGQVDNQSEMDVNGLNLEEIAEKYGIGNTNSSDHITEIDASKALNSGINNTKDMAGDINKINRMILSVASVGKKKFNQPDSISLKIKPTTNSINKGSKLVSKLIKKFSKEPPK